MVAFAAKLFKARDALAPFAAVTDALQGDQATIFTLFDGILNLTQHVHTHRAAESWATIAHEEVNRRWLTNWINDAVLLSVCVSPISWAKLNAEAYALLDSTLQRVGAPIIAAETGVDEKTAREMASAELSRLTRLVKPGTSTSMEHFWDVHGYSPMLSRLFLVLMDVAITEASVERSFSVHKALHTAKRHSLENAGAQTFLSSNPRVPQVSQFRAATPIPDSELVVDVLHRYAEMLTPDPPLE